MLVNVSELFKAGMKREVFNVGDSGPVQCCVEHMFHSWACYHVAHRIAHCDSAACFSLHWKLVLTNEKGAVREWNKEEIAVL